MSWSFEIVGRDKQKVKEAIRAQQCPDEEKNPHTGVPSRVVQYLCAEVDRCRIYEWNNNKYALYISASGSFHEQGSNETITVRQLEVVE